MAESKLSILVQALGAAKAAKELRGVDKAISSIGARAGQGLRTAGANLKTLGVIAGGVVAAGIVASVKAAANFESQLNTINTIARATPDRLDAIGDSIRKLARDTGTPLEDLTQGYYDLLSAGIKAADATNVLTAANTLAIGGLSTSAEAVDLLTTAINVYGGDASKAAQFADEFAKSIERGKVTASELAASYAQAAPPAKEMGVENAELAAGFARLTAAGTPASEAATQMASALTALLKKTPQLEKLEKATKKNYAALAGSKGLNVALEQMRVDAGKAGIELVDLVGRKEALLYILQSTGPNLRAYKEDLAAMGDAAGTAAGQMAERQKGLNFQLSRLKALAKDAGITIGNALLPKLTPLVEKAVAFLSTHEADIERFGEKIAGAFDKAFEFATKIPWEQVGAGLQIAADWAGKLMDVFLNLPPEVQTTLIALAGLNKLSGGAIGGIVGELGKGLIKGVLGMNAGVVNINAGVVNGAGGVPGAAGKGGFGLTNAIGAAAGVTVAGAGLALIADAVAQGIPERPGMGGKRKPLTIFDKPRAQPSDPRKMPSGTTPGWGARFAIGSDPRVATEQAALAKFTASTAPSMKSMEAHLANLKALQTSTPARDQVNTGAIVAAINRLGVLLGIPPVVNVSSNAVTKAQRQTYRVGGSSRVTVS